MIHGLLSAVLPLVLLIGEAVHAASTVDEYQAALNDVPTADSLRGTHDMICVEPHPAGTKADERATTRLARWFEDLGLQTTVEPFFAYLPSRGSASVTVLPGEGGDPIELRLQEEPVDGDPFSGHPDIGPGWNAYSGSGEASGEIVYANYGTKEDFATLRELGIDLRGCIVIARYGGNFRGYKAKFAEEAGAAGLIIYTDPADSGWGRGIPWPEGGWANGSYIQRGSIKTLPYPGDPLTPGTPATEDARRLDPDSVALPRIPVQPVGWDAAAEILSRMKGPGVPRGWQGGLPFAYRVTAASGVRVRLRVDQDRGIKKAANVIATLPGTEHPEQKVIVGCHFDAWTFGAADPHAGTIVLCEIARSFAEAARRGYRPRRSIVFAHWGAEEYGIIGSTEWCERHGEDLQRNAIAYLNLDVAAMGPKFRCSAAPVLKKVIEDAARTVADPYHAGATVHDSWTARRDGVARFGHLGGGSDHVGFYCHLGIPSAGMSAGGSKGTAYHSAYDNLAWYRKVVGDDYRSGLMLTHMGNAIVARLAHAPVLPLGPVRYAEDLLEHLDTITALAAENGVTMDCDGLIERVGRCRVAARRVADNLGRAEAAGLSPEVRSDINRRLLTLERIWLDDSGLPGRPWYRSLYAAPDPDSGYAPWILPGLRAGIAAGEVDRAILRYESTLDRLTRTLDDIWAGMADQDGP